MFLLKAFGPRLYIFEDTKQPIKVSILYFSRYIIFFLCFRFMTNDNYYRSHLSRCLKILNEYLEWRRGEGLQKGAEYVEAPKSNYGGAKVSKSGTNEYLEWRSTRYRLNLAAHGLYMYWLFLSISFKHLCIYKLKLTHFATLLSVLWLFLSMSFIHLAAASSPLVYHSFH